MTFGPPLPMLPSEAPQQTLDQLQPFVAAARSLHNNAAQQQTATIEQLFDDLTYTTVLEYLAPEGTHQIPTNPAELVALAQQRIGDFTQVVSDLTAKHDFRSYIFSKRAPDIAEIEKAILSVHDLAITNQLAGGANIGASFQAAAW